MACQFNWLRPMIIAHITQNSKIVYVGYALLPKQDWKTGKFSRFDTVVGLLMAILSLATFSLDKAMLLGFGAYSLEQVFIRKEKANPYLCLLYTSDAADE